MNRTPIGAVLSLTIREMLSNAPLLKPDAL